MPLKDSLEGKIHIYCGDSECATTQFLCECMCVVLPVKFNEVHAAFASANWFRYCIVDNYYLNNAVYLIEEVLQEVAEPGKKRL